MHSSASIRGDGRGEADQAERQPRIHQKRDRLLWRSKRKIDTTSPSRPRVKPYRALTDHVSHVHRDAARRARLDHQLDELEGSIEIPHRFQERRLEVQAVARSKGFPPG